MTTVTSKTIFPFANTVNVEAANELANLATQLQQRTVQVRDAYGGSGSGVIWNADGLVITNAHVIRSGWAKITLHTDRILDAVVIARDTHLDLVALRFSQPVGGLSWAIAANSDNLRVGELVVAVGNPLGMVGALNTGIVTCVPYSSNLSNRFNRKSNRKSHPISDRTSSRKFDDRQWVVSDVQLAPGNSGGLLADARGRAIGINTMIVNDLALAIPSNTVATFLRNSLAQPDSEVDREFSFVRQRWFAS